MTTTKRLKLLSRTQKADEDCLVGFLLGECAEHAFGVVADGIFVQQIELFIELTKGGGTLAERMFFSRKVLTVLTANGERNLFKGLTDMHVLSGGEVLKSGVDTLKALSKKRPV